jgi:uncharacterized membrane protein YqjE
MDKKEDEKITSRTNILSVMDGFIEQIQKQRKIMLGMSVSAIVLAPLAIALSAYLLFHPSFFAILELENEFGLVLSILLAAVILISGIWLVTGIRQYRSISNWKSQYEEFTKDREEIDKKIASRFGLDQQ